MFRYWPIALLIIAVIAVLAWTTGCDNVAVIDKSEQRLISKSELKDYVLVNRQDLEQLKTEAALGKSIGRYHVYTEGFRTFRLDTATGSNCILLATKTDWKNEDTHEQSCGVLDWQSLGKVPYATVSVRTLEPFGDSR